MKPHASLCCPLSRKPESWVSDQFERASTRVQDAAESMDVTERTARDVSLGVGVGLVCALLCAVGTNLAPS